MIGPSLNHTKEHQVFPGSTPKPDANQGTRASAASWRTWLLPRGRNTTVFGWPSKNPTIGRWKAWLRDSSLLKYDWWILVRDDESGKVPKPWQVARLEQGCQLLQTAAIRMFMLQFSCNVLVEKPKINRILAARDSDYVDSSGCIWILAGFV